jgi:hypothetical protein
MWRPTPTNPIARVFLKHDNDLRRFLRFELNLRGDGSLYGALPREGQSDGGYSWTSEDPALKETSSEPKGIAFSYHTSGMVNPKGFGRGPFFCEPIHTTTHPNFIAGISVPSVDRLDLSNKSSNDAVVIECPVGQRLNFALAIGPISYDWGEPLLASFEIERLFSLALLRAAFPATMTSAELQDHFIFMAPQQGVFGEIADQPENAFVRFHQVINGSDGMTIYGPNGIGEYLVVFAAVKRIPPRATFTLEDPQLTVEIVDKTDHYIRYKVVDKRGATVKRPVPVASLELDARL